eukprot:GHVS01007323.1.p1 GENE.GHVS01007323.1~~GHVS01007323.1.p1  ORF type:complete len:123 (+),score=7.09 GHVS01007323.1:399-767(+)
MCCILKLLQTAADVSIHFLFVLIIIILLLLLFSFIFTNNMKTVVVVFILFVIFVTVVCTTTVCYICNFWSECRRSVLLIYKCHRLSMRTNMLSCTLRTCVCMSTCEQQPTHFFMFICVFMCA